MKITVDYAGATSKTFNTTDEAISSAKEKGGIVWDGDELVFDCYKDCFTGEIVEERF